MNAPLTRRAHQLAAEIGKPERAPFIERQLLAKSFPDKDDILARADVRERRRADRAAAFAKIAAIASFVKPTSSHRTMDQAELAIAYALGEGFTDEHIETLEAECGISSEFAHVLEEKRDAFLRDWGIGK